MRRPFQRCVYRGGSACSCWDIALWVRRPTSSLLEAEKSVDKGLMLLLLLLFFLLLPIFYGFRQQGELSLIEKVSRK